MDQGIVSIFQKIFQLFELQYSLLLYQRKSYFYIQQFNFILWKNVVLDC
ncbi:hypothetical protein LEP1GSC043_2742 [Leptospira weilii str. Ecochallenge]|uniref:Uncharacterized protein n=1 Tax=Leptospira weilii str. Ecochallenge TaxID=1049986 RepID=N1U604_9LEPT|nr:hypothetical protein LEP1GSC043_2742 [Leptospira weilii str. Ecochallenge]